MRKAMRRPQRFMKTCQSIVRAVIRPPIWDAWF